MFEIPIRSRDRLEDYGDPFFRTSVTLEGVPYVFDVRWNDITQAWYLDVLDGGEEPIRTGLKLVLGSLIGWRTIDNRFPNGVLFLSDLSGSGVDAGFQDLGSRVRLYFGTLDEMAVAEDDTLYIPDTPALNLQLAPLDGPGLVYVPQTTAHWTALGITPPTTQADTQVSSGDLSDLTGGAVDMLVQGTGHVFQNLITGWRTYYSVQKPAAQTGHWEYQNDFDISAGESFAYLIYMSWSSYTAQGTIFEYWDDGNNQLLASYDSSDDITVEIDNLTTTVRCPPDENLIVPIFVFKAATFTGSPTETYVTTPYGTGTIATGSGSAASGNTSTRNTANIECNYGPVMAFWDPTDAETLYNQGYYDRTLLEALRWEMEF